MTNHIIRFTIVSSETVWVLWGIETKHTGTEERSQDSNEVQDAYRSTFYCNRVPKNNYFYLYSSQVSPSTGKTTRCWQIMWMFLKDFQSLTSTFVFNNRSSRSPFPLSPVIIRQHWTFTNCLRCSTVKYCTRRICLWNRTSCRESVMPLCIS